MILFPVLRRDPYVIALRSVSLPAHPPTEGYNRGEVLCAGFTILETKNNMSLVKQRMITVDSTENYFHIILTNCNYVFFSRSVTITRRLQRSFLTSPQISPASLPVSTTHSAPAANT